MWKNGLIAFLAIVAVVLGLYSYDLSIGNLELTQLIASLQLHLDDANHTASELGSRLDELQASIKKIEPAATDKGLGELAPPVASPGTKDLAPAEESRAAWQANFLLQQVDGRIALSESERKRLLDLFNSGKGLDSIAEVVGEEREANFAKEEQKAAADAEEEEFQNELFRLSRKLNLNPSQENQLELALRTEREADKADYSDLRTRTERAMALHSEPLGDGSELRSLYDQIKASNQALRARETQKLSEQLQGTLTDEQMNLLVAQ